MMPLWLSVCLLVVAVVLAAGLVAWVLDRSNHA